MHYDISIWKKDGNREAEIEIASFRVQDKSQIQEIFDKWATEPRAVRITIEKPEEFETIWIKPGYKDPFK